MFRASGVPQFDRPHLGTARPTPRSLSPPPLPQPGLYPEHLGLGRHRGVHPQCALTSTPTAADAGRVPDDVHRHYQRCRLLTSGTLTITPGTQTMACTAPASGGTSTTWGSSAGGTNNSYSVACYGEVASTGVSGVTPYPTSIVPTTPANLPADLVSATSTSSTPACTKSTSGSGTTEEYILTCPQTEDSVSSDNGTYSSTFTASDSNSGGTATSGAWNLTVTGPADICTAPASGGTATTFKAGIANSYSVVCYGTGFASANAGNYPASITLNSGTLPADASEATSTSSSPACTQSHLGLGHHRGVHPHLPSHRDTDGGRRRYLRPDHLQRHPRGQWW